MPETKPPAPEVKKDAPKNPSSTGFACSVCGKELKDGRFAKCYECNVAAKASPSPEEQKSDVTTTGFKCVDCGCALKDDKYTKCFPCNKKNPVKKQWSGKSKGSYDDSPEKQLRIQKGNALNAAASVLCGASCLDGKDADEIAQVTQYLANLLLDYLKQE
jgi:DNA-directed RNA polymerase subunit RPC12/RpoP